MELGTFSSNFIATYLLFDLKMSTRTNKHNMLYFIIFAWIAAGALSIAQYISDSKNEEKLNSKVDSLTKINLELKKDNKKLSKKLDENVIGAGDLDIEVKVAGGKEMFFRFVNNAYLPVYDAQITYYDYSEIMKCDFVRNEENGDVVLIDGDCLKANRFRVFNEVFNPGSGYLADGKKFKITEGYMNFEIIIQTRKSFLSHYLVCKVIDKKIVYAKRTYEVLGYKMKLISESDPIGLPEDFWDSKFYGKQLGFPNL